MYIKWLFRLLIGVGMAVICYFMLSFILDTPIESQIKKSTQKLEQEYRKLSARYDTLEQIAANLSVRDSSVYRMIFESEPYNPHSDSINEGGIHTYDELMAMTNKEMGDEFVERMGTLYQRVSVLDARNNSMERYFYDHRDQINGIPSIQPVINPDLSLLAASFGDRIHPFYKSMVFHKGVDYSVPTGSAVFATADGVVSMIESRGQVSGLLVSLEHTNGYETRYANLDRVIVSVGSRVQRGDIIAFSGNSGLSYGPHLHYEVRYRNKPVDPLNFFFMELDLQQMGDMREIAQTGMQSFD